MNQPVLPQLLADIAEVTNLETAMAVARAKGGTRCYFPPVPDQSHWLHQLVGREKAIAICERLTQGFGCELLIPMGPDASRLARWRRLRELSKQGYNRTEISRIMNVHIRTVSRHKADDVKSARHGLGQRDLFED